jgi:hypothetical protein
MPLVAEQGVSILALSRPGANGHGAAPRAMQGLRRATSSQGAMPGVETPAPA